MTYSMTQDSEGSSTSARDRVEVALVAVGAVALLAARVPVATRQLWAEDGTVFLQGALDRGLLRPFGAAYAGYFHFVPRVIGAASSLVPLRAAATTTWLLVAAVIGWSAATIYAASRPWIASRIARAALAFAVALLPSLTDEGIANAANLQFVLLFAALTVLISPAGRSGSRVNSCVLLVATGLTTPLSLVLLPFAVWRLIRRRSIRPDVESISWAIGIAGQFIALAIVRPERTASVALPARSIATSFVKQVAIENAGGLPASSVLGRCFAIIAVSVTVTAVVVAWRRGERERAGMMVGVPVLGFTLWVFFGVRIALEADLPPRYQLFSTMCLLWTLLVAVDELARAAAPARASWVAPACLAAASGLLVVSWLTNWSPNSYRTTGPSWSTSLSEATAKCQHPEDVVAVTIMPVVDQEGPGWVVHVRCDALG